MTSFPSLFVVMFFCQVFLHNIAYSGQMTVHSDHDTALLANHCHPKTTSGVMERCLEQCLANCSCLSFQICGEVCELCTSSRYLHPQDMHIASGCINSNFGDHEMPEKKQCDGTGCITGVNCCLMSNPCQNGGTCYPRNVNSRKRFTCKCPHGYHGDHCEKTCRLGYQGPNCAEPIRSCRGYRHGTRVPGHYTVIDATSTTPFTVYCDFSTTNTMTWTLVQSHALAKRAENFVKPFYLDRKKNEDHPEWIEYRLSKSRMESIASDSYKWRGTCCYDRDGLVYDDYIRGRLSVDFNILTYNGHGCVYLERINVRGYSCSNCTAYMFQRHEDILHFDSAHAQGQSCDFKPEHSKTTCPGSTHNGEDNFGFYDCTNPKHRCTSSQQATTQTWFGGK